MGLRSTPRPGSPKTDAVVVYLPIALIPVVIWQFPMQLMRFRISGDFVAIERLYRPFRLFDRAVSFHLSQIDQVEINPFPHDQRYGTCVRITLQGGRRIEYEDDSCVADTVAQQLELAIERSRQVPHPLSDEAIR